MKLLFRIPIIKIRRIILFIPAKQPSYKSSPHSLPSLSLKDHLFCRSSSGGTRICGTLLSLAAAILWRWSVLVRVRVETVVTQCFFTCISYETQIYNLQSKTWDIYNIDHSLKSLSTNLHFFLVPYQQSISFTAHKFHLQSTCFCLL